MVRPVGSQAVPASQTPNANLTDRPTADENLKKAPEQPQKSSNSFEKIMMRLSTLFPNYSRLVLVGINSIFAVQQSPLYIACSVFSASVANPCSLRGNCTLTFDYNIPVKVIKGTGKFDR